MGQFLEILRHLDGQGLHAETVLGHRQRLRSADRLQAAALAHPLDLAAPAVVHRVEKVSFDGEANRTGKQWWQFVAVSKAVLCSGPQRGDLQIVRRAVR